MTDDLGHTPLEMAADREYEQSSREKNLIMVMLQKPSQAKQMIELFLGITTRIRQNQATASEPADWGAGRQALCVATNVASTVTCHATPHLHPSEHSGEAA